MKRLKVILVGGGDRGMRYTKLMGESPEEYEVIAVAEPLENRREFVRDRHGIPEIWESYYNHSVVFAAERSRAEGTVIDF